MKRGQTKEPRIECEYFGAAAFRITTATGKILLIDPYITDNPLCSKSLEYFFDADLIVVTHGAFDHMGDTVEIMKNSKANLVCGPDVQKYALLNKISKDRVTATCYGIENQFDGIGVRAVDARHVSRVMTKNEDILFYGIPMGFVITTEDNIRVYHTGDTSIFGDMRLIGSLYKPNILMICVSSVSDKYAPEMSPGEAALATLWIAPDVVIPMHYPPKSTKPSEFCDALKFVAPNVEPILMKPNSKVTYRKYLLESSKLTHNKIS